MASCQGETYAQKIFSNFLLTSKRGRGRPRKNVKKKNRKRNQKNPAITAGLVGESHTCVLQ